MMMMIIIIIIIMVIIMIIIIIIIITYNKNFIHRLKKKIIYRFKNMNIKIYTLCTFFLCTKENCRKMTI